MGNGEVALSGSDGAFEGAEMTQSNVCDVVHGLRESKVSEMGKLKKVKTNGKRRRRKLFDVDERANPGCRDAELVQRANRLWRGAENECRADPEYESSSASHRSELGSEVSHVERVKEGFSVFMNRQAASSASFFDAT